MFKKSFNLWQLSKMKNSNGESYKIARVSKEKDGTLTVILKEVKNRE